MYALIEVKGKQYKAEKDALIKVDRFSEKEGEALELDSVMMIGGDKVKIGNPYIKGAKVNAVIESHGRDPKVRVFKMKRRKSYRRQYGHRQGYSLLRIKDIAGA